MMKFLQRLIARAVTNRHPATISEAPASLPLTEEELTALEQLSALIYRPLASDVADTARQVLLSQFETERELWIGLQAVNDAIGCTVYLDVDLKDPESAIGFAQDIARLHGLSWIPQPDVPEAVDIVLQTFDIWLAGHGYRFVQLKNVDWGYAGLVVAQPDLPLLLDLGKRLGSSFEAGCSE